MTTKRSEILLHPIRLRIVLASAGEDVTTTDIADRMSDVPQATLYRHVAKLTEAGILDVVGERQARGAVEKTYRVNTAKASVGPTEASAMSTDEHLEALTVFAGLLIETYGRYLKSPAADPATDGVSIRQARLWLTDTELLDLVAGVTDALAPFLDLERATGRTPRLLSTILMPEPSST